MAADPAHPKMGWIGGHAIDRMTVVAMKPITKPAQKT
jgi:hypothetical protein